MVLEAENDYTFQKLTRCLVIIPAKYDKVVVKPAYESVNAAATRHWSLGVRTNRISNREQCRLPAEANGLNDGIFVPTVVYVYGERKNDMK